MIPRNLPTNFLISDTGIFFLNKELIINTNGAEGSYLDYDLTLDVYWPDMPEEEWYVYNLKIIIVACAKEQGVEVAIKDKLGNTFDQDTPVQIALLQNVDISPWK